MPRRNTQQRLNWDGIDFCDPQTISYEKIVNILVGKDKVFPSSLGGIFLNRYKKMQENFSKPISSEDDKGRNVWYQAEDDLSIANAGKFKDALLEIGRDKFNGDSKWVGSDGILSYPCVGHDLPIWMKRKNGGNGKRIMIVAQDPLRTGHGAGTLLVSSPFGFHSADYRSNSTMMQFVHNLVINFGCEIYLTDLMKLYNRDPQPLDANGKSPCKGCVNYERCMRDKKRIHQGKDLIRENLCAKYAECIKNEINEYGPMLVVLLGNEVISQSSLFSDVQPPSCGISIQSGLSINKPIMSLYHPALKFSGPFRRVVGGPGEGIKARYFSKACEEIMCL